MNTELTGLITRKCWLHFVLYDSLFTH